MTVNARTITDEEFFYGHKACPGCGGAPVSYTHLAFVYCGATAIVCVFVAVLYYVLGKLLLVKRGIGGFSESAEKVSTESVGENNL